MEINKIINEDCIEVMRGMQNNCVHLALTDIPYGRVSREDNGLRNLNKKDADIITFDLNGFLNEIYRVTSGTIIIFCGKEQLSDIYEYFDKKQKRKLGTVRQII